VVCVCVGGGVGDGSWAGTFVLLVLAVLAPLCMAVL
jgi:hypothetical protein